MQWNISILLTTSLYVSFYVTFTTIYQQEYRETADKPTKHAIVHNENI